MATGLRIELRVRDDWLKRVDRRAATLGITRSAFIKQAVNAALEPLQPGGVAAMTEPPHCPHTMAGTCDKCRADA